MLSSSFAGRHPVATSLLALLIVLLLGGAAAYFVTDKGKKLLPTLEKATLSTADITADSLKARMKVSLRNHAPLTVRIDSFSYITRLDGAPLARGTENRGLTLKRGGTSELQLPLDVDLSQVKRQIKTIQQDCVDVQTTMIMYTKLPLVGAERIPVTVRKKVYVPKLPKIEIADVDITDLGLRKGAATVKLKVTNYNPFPVTIRSVRYRLRIGGDDMDVRGVQTKDMSFRRRGTEIVPLHVQFEPKALPKVAFKGLFKAEKTPYELSGAVVVAAGRHSPKDMTMNFQSDGSLQDLKDIPK